MIGRFAIIALGLVIASLAVLVDAPLDVSAVLGSFGLFTTAIASAMAAAQVSQSYNSARRGGEPVGPKTPSDVCKATTAANMAKVPG